MNKPPEDSAINTGISDTLKLHPDSPDDLSAILPTVPDRYVLLELIGRGGFGEVWLAKDRVLDRNVAFKILRTDRVPGEDSVNRFVYEARTTSQLGHPGIIPVHDAGALPDGRLFYAMQFIARRTLESILDGLRNGDPEITSSYPLPRLLHAFLQICQAMAYAHDHGFIHRDLKPANILLGNYGEHYIADWGLAKPYRVKSGESTASGRGKETVQGVVLGTPQYMSPEQAQGEVADLTPETDVWSLGVILYEILTLQVPFSGPTHFKILIKVVSHPITEPRIAAPSRSIPEKISDLCLQMLDREVKLRPTAKHAADRVSSFLDGIEEQAKRSQAAREHFQRAKGLQLEHMKLIGDLAEQRARVSIAKRNMPRDTPIEHKMRLWRYMQELEEQQVAAELLHGRLVETLSQSLGYEDTPEAHDLLAELYWTKAEMARKAYDRGSAAFFRALVRQHDTGRFRAQLSETARLIVRSTVSTRFKLEQQVPFGPLLVSEERRFDGGPVELPAGSYIVEVLGNMRVPVRLPIVLEGGEERTIEIEPPRSFIGSDEFVYVAAGATPLGGDELAVEPLEMRIVDLPAFLIGKFPITVQQYCTFLNSIAKADFEKAKSHAPRSQDGSIIWLDVDESRRNFAVPKKDRRGDAWDPHWPVLMINWDDAQAYCSWRTQQEGATYRLPTEQEWEKAARGVDGRYFPWGNGFDPTLCRMADSADGRQLPVPVGTYELDRSPYGVHDLAGLVVEWTATPVPLEERRYVRRGGGIFSPAAWCRAASRKSASAQENAIQCGFRVVRALDP